MKSLWLVGFLVLMATPSASASDTQVAGMRERRDEKAAEKAAVEKQINEDEIALEASKQETKKFRVEFERLSKETKELKKRLTALHKTVTAAQAKEAQARDAFDSMKAQVNHQAESVKAGEDELKQAEENIKEAKHGLEEVLKERRNVEGRIAEIKRQRVEMKRAHDALIEQTRAETGKLRLAIAAQEELELAADKERNQKEMENSEIKAKLGKLQALANTRERAMKDAQEHLKQTTKVLEDTRGFRDDLNRKIGESEAQTNRLVQEKQKATVEINRLKADIQELQARLKAAEQKRAEYDEDYKGVSGELTKLRAQNKSKQDDVAKKESDVRELHGVIEAGKEEIEKAKKEHDELLKRDRKAQIDKVKLQAQRDLLTSQYKQITQENRNLRENNRSINSVPRSK